MKKIGFILLFLFLLATAFYAVVQSEIGRNWVRKKLENTLRETGVSAQIDKIEGTLPHEILLKGVRVEGNDFSATIESIRFRPVLWRLLKKEIALNDIQAKGVSIQESAPFDFKGVFRTNRKRVFVRGEVGDWSLFLRYHLLLKQADFSVENEEILVRGDADLLPTFTSHLQIRSDLLMASLKIHQERDSYLAFTDWQLTPPSPFKEVQGTGEASYREGVLKGKLTTPLHAEADFELTREKETLFSGTSHLQIDNLQNFLPNIFGKLEAKAVWDGLGKEQLVHLDLIANNFYYQDLFAETLSLSSDLTDPFRAVNGEIDLSAQKLKWKHLALESASLKTKLGEEKTPFTLFAEGSYRHPFELRSTGFWNDQSSFQIETSEGSFLGKPFHLDAPLRLVYTPDAFQLKNASFTIGEGSLFLDIQRQKDEIQTQVRLKEFPLDFLSLNPLEVAVGGTLDLNADIQEKKQTLKGTFQANVHQTAPIESSGSFQGNFNHNFLKVQGGLAVREQPFFELNLILPIHFSLWPFKTELLFHKKAKGTLAFDGRVEELLDYFDLGPHRLEGHLKGALTFHNTLYRPLLEGNFVFENGFYENFYSGTTLTDLSAEVVAEKNTLHLRSLSASDRPGLGTLKGTGKLHLLPSDLYPFQLNLDLEGLQFTEIDLVKATAFGNIHLEGNALSALAKGVIEIQNCELTIPDHISRPLPDLDVVYRNPIHPVPPPKKEFRPYPLRLDLQVSTPTEITIMGRGLSSRWKGHFHLGGTYDNLSTKGTLELLEGDFHFSSREFKLTEGTLTFSGIAHQMPYLNLAGQMETKGIAITARLKGPLDNPQITLLSNPPLPLGSILSYLLFGQDISEIGGFQALQIAASLASLAGTGSDVMESARKSLGVDRLRVVTEPTEEGGETVALQVGKYISEGVLVSFTQGPDESSTNISVEIELKNNFVFQIESDQRQEQGKFTLKWNLNY